MSVIEIIGVLVSALAIGLTARRKVACWPVGLVSVALYGWIFFDAKLYSDMLLQGAFAVMQLYGWWRWLRAAPGERDSAEAAAAVDVRMASVRDLVPGVVAGALGSVALGAVMAHFTDAALPWVDASLSAFSLVAQYWTARKYIASWWLWIVVDCIYVAMFVFKELYPTSVLYAFFVILAVIGWRDWRRTWLKQREAGKLQAAGAGSKRGADPSASLEPAPRPDVRRDLRSTMPSANDEPARTSGAAARTTAPVGAYDAALASESNRQFGVSGEQAERDWPLMIVSEVASVLASYPVEGSIERLSWHSPRPFAAAALATMRNGESLFIKRHHTRIRDVAALGEEHRFIAHLASRGVPVVQVLPDRLGRTAIAIGEWTYEVHRAAEGVDAYRNAMSWEPFRSLAHARSAGSTLAMVHRAAADYDAPPRPPRLLVSSLQSLGAPNLIDALSVWIDRQPLLARALSRRPWQRDIAAVIGPYHAQLQPLLHTLPSLWTHGDWHASNLFWSGAGHDASVSSVLDFGLADRTCAINDLALAIERNTIEWLVEPARRGVHLDQIDALLDGYASVLPLTANDYAALIALLPIVHTEFALSEVAYFDGVLDAPDAAEIAYDGYLLGHARWFGQAAGRALLTHLTNRQRGLTGA